MKTSISPNYLKPNDAIAIVATARKISFEELAPALDLIRQWGYEPVLGRHVFDINHQFAGTDAARTADIQWALDDTTIKAILIVRGGYGTIRIMDAIRFENFFKHPKWLIGYSDVTVLHAHLNNLGMQSLHATMPINFFKNHAATLSLKTALEGQLPTYNLPAHPLNRSGVACAPLVGGNLSILFAISGSPSDLNSENCILFLEDLDEYLYHIDRMLMQLKRSGKLAKLKGLIVGGMSDMKDNTVPFGKTAESIILEAVSAYDYPVCFGFPAGHIDDNRALFLGKTISLRVNANATQIHYTETI